MKEGYDKVLDLIKILSDASTLLSKRQRNRITPRDVELALVKILDLDCPTDLLSISTSIHEVVDRLAEYDFHIIESNVISKVELEESIIPPSTTTLLTAERIKTGGEIWYIHKTDVHSFPSDPHAHNYQTGHKLSLSTGKLYLGKRVVGRIRPKSLRSLRSRIKGVVLPPLEV